MTQKPKTIGKMSSLEHRSFSRFSVTPAQIRKSIFAQKRATFAKTLQCSGRGRDCQAIWCVQTKPIEPDKRLRLATLPKNEKAPRSASSASGTALETKQGFCGIAQGI